MKAALMILLLVLGFLFLMILIGLVALWFGGGKIIFIPGLEIVIATPLLVSLLAALEVLILVSAFLLWRTSW